MTQEVQPLTWQKRTNLEEHQQFFSKINEIIANLAPTVDEAEAAIAQANQAIASANAAISTANAASANADAASQQAQTAANTVAGYDARLTTAEGDIDVLQAADQTISGNVAALGTRMTAAESKNTQQDSAISALQTADANDVKITGEHAIGNYAVLLTGNQGPITGVKSFANSIIYLGSSSPTMKPGNDEKSTVPASELTHNMVLVQDDAGNNLAGIFSTTGTDGKRHVTAYVFDCDGNYRSQMIV